MSNQTPLKTLAAQAKFRLDKKVAERLAALDKTHQLAMQRLGDLSASDLRGVWESLQAKALDALRKAQTIDDVAEISEPTKSAIRAAAADSRASLKHSLRELSKEAVEIATPEIRRFVLSARQHVEELSAAERALAESFNLPPLDGPVTLALRAEIDRLASSLDRPWLGQIVRPGSLVEAFTTL
jgi:hypothetical protein